MGRELNLLLRRTSPLAAVLVLLAPAAGHASSFSPDPPPGANGLIPDAAPSASSRPPAAVQHAPARAVARPAAVQTVTAPAPVRAVPRRPRHPAVRPRPHAIRIAIPKLQLPPVVVPAFIPSALGRRPQADLAALALALAALTAGSGAGLVRVWSRR